MIMIGCHRPIRLIFDPAHVRCGLFRSPALTLGFCSTQRTQRSQRSGGQPVLVSARLVNKAVVPVTEVPAQTQPKRACLKEPCDTGISLGSLVCSSFIVGIRLNSVLISIGIPVSPSSLPRSLVFYRLLVQLFFLFTLSLTSSLSFAAHRASLRGALRQHSL